MCMYVREIATISIFPAGFSDDINPKYLVLIALGPLMTWDAFTNRAIKNHLLSPEMLDKLDKQWSISPTMCTSGVAAVAESYKTFNPSAYLQNNYMPPRANFTSEEFAVPWKLRCLADTFATGRCRPINDAIAALRQVIYFLINI